MGKRHTTKFRLPADDEMPEELIGQYDEIRKLFLTNPTSEAIPLLLISFGKGDGFGVYQLVEDVLQWHEEKEVIPHLINALES